MNNQLEVDFINEFPGCGDKQSSQGYNQQYCGFCEGDLGEGCSESLKNPAEDINFSVV